MRTIVAPFMEFKLDSGAPGRFKGYGSTFNNVDFGNDRCIKGCFERSLKEHRSASTLPAMYWMHDRGEPIGDWLDMAEDSKGLVVEGQLWTGSQETQCSLKALNMLKGTGPKGLSIGYKTKKYEYDQKTNIRSLLDVDLPEVSVVGYGMNPKAIVTNIKSLFADGAVPTIRELEEFLRDAGLSAVQAKALLSEGFKGIMRDADSEKSREELIKELKAVRAIYRGDPLNHD